MSAPVLRRAVSPPGPGDLSEIAAIVEAEAGITIAESKSSMIQSRLAGRLRSLGLPDYRAYIDLVTSAEGAGERLQMVSALTTNVSHFFRESHHFDLLRSDILPPLVDRARRGGRVRIWSAGCSRGQEAYSIAMTILELLPDAGERDIRILASDIDRAVLADADRAEYDEASVSQVQPELRGRYFESAGEGWKVTPRVRGLVTFRELNLHADWPMAGRFDAIFCRNVVIYFSQSRQTALWPRFIRALATGGWLIVGHSERIPAGLGVIQAGVTVYRRSTDRNA
ncbi:MAG: CheR family methyltransferase [Paracoccaceae bacterium]